jgi:hypothetical protein
MGVDSSPWRGQSLFYDSPLPVAAGLHLEEFGVAAGAGDQLIVRAPLGDADRGEAMTISNAASLMSARAVAIFCYSPKSSMVEGR